jgi:hypothetical protein
LLFFGQTCASLDKLSDKQRCDLRVNEYTACALRWELRNRYANDTRTLRLNKFSDRTCFDRPRAKESGVRFGRPHKLTPHQRQEALARREAGETLMDIARSYGVSHPTISRL